MLRANSSGSKDISCVCTGVARGCGRQDLCATLSFMSVYGVGLPLGIILGFVYHIGAKVVADISCKSLSLFTLAELSRMMNSLILESKKQPRY